MKSVAPLNYSTSPMKILISAYSCEPGKGSEPGIGWNVVREVARHHQVWVLTRPDESKTAIEAELAQHPVPNLKFVYFTLPFWQDSMRLGQSGAMQAHYYLWQIQAYWVARRLHKKIGFDIAHHVTFNRYSTPSFLSLLPIPFVFGPVGGGEQAPSAFFEDFNTKAKIYEFCRWLAHKLGEIDPFSRLTARRSTWVYATTHDTAERLNQMGAHDVHVSQAIGLSPEDLDQLGQYSLSTTGPIRFFSIGRLLHWKGFHLGIRAFAKANLKKAEYWIIGEGPELDNLRSLAQQLKITDQVKFWGALPRHQTLEKLSQSHVLLHPSLHDSGGWVCLESMAAGRPVICLDIGGPAVQVTPKTGVKIPAHSPEQVVDEMSEAIAQLAKEPHLLADMGNAGKALVNENYSWQTKGHALSQLYQKLCNPLLNLNTPIPVSQSNQS